MKKFFLLLLLFVLPLQLSWAAASAYCQHEEGKAARHLGHHSHQHQADAADAADTDQGADKNAKGQPHSDCHVCHGIGHAWLPPGDRMTMFEGASQAVAAIPLLYTSHIPDAPKRPDWLPLA